MSHENNNKIPNISKTYLEDKDYIIYRKKLKDLKKEFSLSLEIFEDQRLKRIIKSSKCISPNKNNLFMPPSFSPMSTISTKTHSESKTSYDKKSLELFSISTNKQSKCLDFSSNILIIIIDYL